jgi:hopene-associated glycosyltransferase HpnB
MTLAFAGAMISLAIWLYLLLARGGFWRERPRPAPSPPGRWPEIVAVVPARDEAETIAIAIGSLLRQHYPGRLSVVLVDDQSSDGTAALARAAANEIGAVDRLTVITARKLPNGWTGKLWAVSEGLRHVEESGSAAELILLTDADIAHHEDNLAELTARILADRLDLASLMVLLRCESFAERWLVPAFVFFFEKLYPFAWVNDRRKSTAAAAGGCMLLRRTALHRIGGIASIRGALIDDCALGAKIKAGGGIWLGLTDRTRSLRRYPRLGDIWRMIARTAYTQLEHSPILLVIAVLGLFFTYLLPPLLVVVAGGVTVLVALAAWLGMSIAFIPTLRLYRRSRFTALLLPLIALFYLAATLDSARRHWQGRGGEWKGRVQQRSQA